MESKKNELEPTEIAQHLRGNAKVGGDFLYISPEAYRRISRAEFMLAYGHLVRVVESAVKGRPAQEPRLKTLIAVSYTHLDVYKRQLSPRRTRGAP